MPMDYANCKVYSDGSHYIAIPYVPNPHARKRNVQTVANNADFGFADELEETSSPKPTIDIKTGEIVEHFQSIENKEKPPQNTDSVFKNSEAIDYKEIFEFLYKVNFTLKKKDLRALLIENMTLVFGSEEKAKQFVDVNLGRKERNAICRRKRLVRKVNLEQNFNYFCTFTYDSAKHSEESFRKKLSDCFKMMCHRKGWKYCGVWERSPEKQRLHFHGIFVIPEGTMPGELLEVTDFDTRGNKMRTTLQNTYFNDKFGRSDFEPIASNANLGRMIQYLVKYIEKTGEKIVYSKNLPQYFYSDIEGKDIVCDFGLDGKKKLLFDNFTCWDYGEYKGQVSNETIAQMRKGN